MIERAALFLLSTKPIYSTYASKDRIVLCDWCSQRASRWTSGDLLLSSKKLAIFEIVERARVDGDMCCFRRALVVERAPLSPFSSPTKQSCQLERETEVRMRGVCFVLSRVERSPHLLSSSKPSAYSIGNERGRVKIEQQCVFCLVERAPLLLLSSKVVFPKEMIRRINQPCVYW